MHPLFNCPSKARPVVFARIRLVLRAARAWRSIASFAPIPVSIALRSILDMHPLFKCASDASPDLLTRIHLALRAARALRSLASLAPIPIALRNILGRSIGHRMADVSEAERQAEAQLTSRYWMFLAGLSGAVSYVLASKVQAAALAVRSLASQGIADTPA